MPKKRKAKEYFGRKTITSRNVPMLDKRTEPVAMFVTVTSAAVFMLEVSRGGCLTFSSRVKMTSLWPRPEMGDELRAG